MPIETKRADVSQVNQSILDFEPLKDAVKIECGDRVTKESTLRTKPQACQDAVSQAQTNQAKIADELRKVVEGGLYKGDGTIISRLGEVCPEMEMPVDPDISYANRFITAHRDASICSQRVSILFAEDPTKPAEPVYILKDKHGHTWESIDKNSKDPSCNEPAVKTWAKGTDEPADPAPEPAPAPEPTPAPAPAPEAGVVKEGEKADMLETLPTFTPAELGDEFIAAMEKRWGEDGGADRIAFSQSLKNANYDDSVIFMTALVADAHKKDAKKFEGAIPEITPIKVPEFVEVADADNKPVPMKDAAGNQIKVDDVLQNDDDAEIKRVFDQVRKNTLNNIAAYARYLATEVFNTDVQGPEVTKKTAELINEWGKTSKPSKISVTEDLGTQTYEKENLNSGKEMSALLRDFESFAKAKREKLMKDKPKPNTDFPKDLEARINSLPTDEVAWMAQVKAELNKEGGWRDRNAAFLIKAQRPIQDLLNETDASMFRLRLEKLSSGVEAHILKTLGLEQDDNQTVLVKEVAARQGIIVKEPPAYEGEDKNANANAHKLGLYFRDQAWRSSERAKDTKVNEADIEALLKKMGYVSDKRKTDKGAAEPMNHAELNAALGAIKTKADYDKFAGKAKEWAEDNSEGPKASGKIKGAGGAAPGKGSSRKDRSNYGLGGGAEVTKDLGDEGSFTLAIGGSLAGNSGVSMPSVGGITPKKEPKSSGPALSDLNGTYTTLDYGDNVAVAGVVQVGIIEDKIGGNAGAVIKYKRDKDGKKEEVVATTVTAGYYHQELGNEQGLSQKVLDAKVTWTPHEKVAVEPGVSYTFNDPEGGEETEEWGGSLGVKYNPKDKGGFGEFKYSYNSPFGGNQHLKLLQVASSNLYVQGGYRWRGFLESAYAFYDHSLLDSDGELGGTVVGGTDTGARDKADAIGAGVNLKVSKSWSVSPWFGYRILEINTQANEGRWRDDGIIFGAGLLYTY